MLVVAGVVAYLDLDASGLEGLLDWRRTIFQYFSMEEGLR